MNRKGAEEFLKTKRLKQKNPKDQFLIIGIAALIYILIALVTTTLGVFFKLPFPDGYEEFFTIFAIFITVIFFMWGTQQKKKEHRLNQEGLLRNLLFRLEYLGSKDVMYILNEPRESHLKWFSKLIFKGAFPAHRMLELNADFFVSKLDETIGGKSTYELKKYLFLATDKINMINYWNQRALEIFSTPGITEDEIKTFYEKFSGFIKAPIEKLQELIPEMKNHIESEFGVYLIQDLNSENEIE